jgi:hypothetical protein
MARFLFVLVAGLFAGAAAAAAPDAESVLVEGGALDGVWNIDIPTEVSLSPGHPAQFGAMAKRFCRFEGKKDNIGIRCFSPLHYAQRGTTDVAGNKLHLSWGNALIRFAIDAVPDSPFHFGGTFTFKFMGLSYVDPEPATGEKFNPANAVADSDGRTKLMTRALQEISAGGLRAPHDAAAIKKNLGEIDALSAESLGALGAIQTVKYLGPSLRSRAQKPEYFFSVYQVEFAHGERLCGLHQRDDGVLDALMCV